MNLVVLYPYIQITREHLDPGWLSSCAPMGEHMNNPGTIVYFSYVTIDGLQENTGHKRSNNEKLC